MICQKCSQRPATVFFSQTVGNQTTHSHLCEICAMEQSKAYGGAVPFGFNPFASISELINNFMNWEEGPIVEVGSGRSGSVSVDPQLQCPHCGYQLSTFRQNGRLGCTKCYESFRAALEPLVSSIHGNVRHAAPGAVPVGTSAPEGAAPIVEERRSQNPEVKALRDKIGEAIKNEQYEEAARLRDEIKKIEGK